MNELGGRDASWELPQPNQDLEDAKGLFAGEGLGFPPIPAEMIPQFHTVSPWIFGTRDGTPSPYNLSWFVSEVAENAVPDYLLMGHAGRGTNSWALHYYLVRGPLAVFLQSAWGGIYTTNEAAVETMKVRFALAEELTQAVEEARQKQRLELPERRVVVVSDFYGFRWATLNSPGDNGGKDEPSPEWHSRFIKVHSS